MRGGRHLAADAPVRPHQQQAFGHGAQDVVGLLARGLGHAVRRAQLAHELEHDEHEVEQRQHDGRHLDGAHHARLGACGLFHGAGQIVALPHEADVARHGLGGGHGGVVGIGLLGRYDGGNGRVQRLPLAVELVPQLAQRLRVDAEQAEFSVGGHRCLERRQPVVEACCALAELGHAGLDGQAFALLGLQREQGLGDLLRQHAQLARGVDAAGVALQLNGRKEVEKQNPQVQHDEQEDGEQQVAVLSQA